MKLEWRKVGLYTILLLGVTICFALVRTTYDWRNTRLDEIYSIVSANEPTYKLVNANVTVDNKSTQLVEETPQERKIILGYTDWFVPWIEVIDFTGCKYNSCRLSTNKSELELSFIVLLELKHLQWKYQLPKHRHSKQYWTFIAQESAGFTYNRFKEEWNGLFNISITYRNTSTIPNSIYRTESIRRKTRLESKNYFKNKDKDMLAYVSNCDSVGYNRLELMHMLSRHGLSLDLYGACGKKGPNSCKKNGFRKCSLHSKYKFYLSFENSLCTEYITEKFWKVISSDHYMIPVAMGGLSIEEYTRVAPPDSFIHVENFTSVEELGKYLQMVASDPDTFNRYHKWREDYSTTESVDIPSCELCRVAHEQPSLPGITSLTQWWNSPNTCRKSLIK